MNKIKYEVVKFDTSSSMGKTSRKSRFSSAVLNKNLLSKAARIEKFKRISKENQRNLKIGILSNAFDETQDRFEQKINFTNDAIKKALKSRNYEVTFFDLNNFPKTINDLKKSDVDLIINVGERLNQSSFFKPHITALLDSLQIPYSGSALAALTVTQDKIKFKKMLNFHGIPTSRWDYMYFLDDSVDENLHYPLIVKPAVSDNAFGITNESIVNNKEELNLQVKKIIKEMGTQAIIEEYIKGDEYDVCILGSDPDDLEVLPLSRSIFKELPEKYPQIYTFEAKWSANPDYDNIVVQRPPKNISKKLETLLTEIALDTYNIFDCQDYGRVEIRIDEDGNPYVLELNANPSLNPNACLAQVAKLIGIDYADLLEEIIAMTIKRYQNKKFDRN